MTRVKSRFLTAIDLLQIEASKEDLTLQRVFSLLGSEGHGALMLFLCLPFLQPLPLPGLSTPLGILIAIVAFYLFRKKTPGLPTRFEKIKISAELISRIAVVAEKIWSVVIKVVKARYEFLVDSIPFRFLSLVVVLVNAFLLALPLPIPFSNTVPVVGIIMTAVGNMEKDGLFILLSYIWCLVVVVFFASLTYGAIKFL